MIIFRNLEKKKKALNLNWANFEAFCGLLCAVFALTLLVHVQCGWWSVSIHLLSL